MMVVSFSEVIFVLLQIINRFIFLIYASACIFIDNSLFRIWRRTLILALHMPQSLFTNHLPSLWRSMMPIADSVPSVR